ncbi:MAG: ribonuclease M5 [Mycoplasmataceae bacterium]|nr:ribonuclease M5 [Mycoplasmataceae bacterium]
MHKLQIKEVIVVEGKTDTAKLKSLLDVDTIETNGSYLSKETIELVKLASKHRGVILFLDPDGPGESIRRKLENTLINFKQAFINKADIKHTKKIGIAEASDQSIINALSSVITFSKIHESLTREEYLALNLSTKSKRKIVADYYRVSESNNKQLFKRLNMMGVTYDEVRRLISSYKGQ